MGSRGIKRYRRSLRKQVLLWVLGAFLLALLVVLAVSYHRAQHEIEEIFDAELAQTAKLMGKLVLTNLDSHGKDVVAEQGALKRHLHKYEKNISYQVWLGDKLVLRSSSAPKQPLATGSGYQNVRIDGSEWRVLGVIPKGMDYRIFTAENNVARDELAWEYTLQSWGILLWSIPLFALVIFFTVDRGLRPLERLSEEVRRRDIGQLEPVNDEDVPRELLPLVDALNGMLSRLDEAIQREKQFTSDASHELRTPLAAIRLHAQLALKADDMDDMKVALNKVMSSVDRSTYLVEQLLTLARLSPDGAEFPVSSLNPASLCRAVGDELGVLAGEQNVRLEYQCSRENMEPVRVNEQLLFTILRNLMDNAIRYSPEGGLIICNIEQVGRKTVISIMDEGPGIPRDQLETVSLRFRRLAGQDVQGCGLGLAIVSQAAARIGAEVKLGNREDGSSGLVARVILGLNPVLS
ncbi:ATP-binding protein [Thiolapillus brandeum]|uniref:histidine kinase n=1 Tax=Thiolapillus brandeum TaxID=1076588 RepID=A0A7U6JID7_9GAMM|nr:ATP-binding protein [Thiolapillus brandeum]BAO45201.1 two-component sensor histidine kinase [Thiolapillus brandeum]